MAAAVRMMSADAVELAKSGYPGLPLGMADVAAVLWGEFLNVVPKDPHWPDRRSLYPLGGAWLGASL